MEVVDNQTRHRQIVYCRATGLLALAAKEGRREEALPLAVTDGRVVRDADAFALVRGVQTSMGVAQARRLCPPLTVVLLEAVDARSLTVQFLDLLADLSPAVEPDGPDGAYADITCWPLDLRRLEEALRALTGFCPALGLGASKLAARACAECDLPPEKLGEASVDWLWPEDSKVAGRLKRLGLETFAAVASVGEEGLFYQFGRIGRLLHRRAHGCDLATVRALYPPPRADDRLDFDEFPLEDRAMVQAALATLAASVSGQLKECGRYGRKVVLRLTTECGEQRREWAVPAAVQGAAEITRAAGRLLMTMTLDAPVLSLRLLVEELETAQAATADLFAGRMLRDTLALEGARRVLAARYGPQALMPLGDRPQTVREKRRSAEHEAWR